MTGDVFYLKKENYKLAMEVKELKRKDERQRNEIDKLRKHMVKLEREMNALKHRHDYTRKTSSDEEIKGNKAVKGNSYVAEKIDKGKRSGIHFEKATLSGTPGCSSDAAYMNRHNVGSQEDDRMNWSATVKGHEETDKELEAIQSTNNKYKLTQRKTI